MENVPLTVKKYLESEDALSRAQLLGTHAELQGLLDSAQVRVAILEWLRGDRAWRSENDNLVENCIEFLTAKASDRESSVIKPFFLHQNPIVRLRAYEYLVSLYFPDHNRDALTVLLHGMLSDSSEKVRREAASFIERAGAVDQLRPFLRRWLAVAKEKGWTETETFELITRLLKQ